MEFWAYIVALWGHWPALSVGAAVAIMSELLGWHWRGAKYVAYIETFLKSRRHYVAITALGVSIFYASYASFTDVSRQLAEEKGKSSDVKQLRDELNQLKGMVQKGSGETEPKSRDPDGIYQLGRIVGKVTGAHRKINDGAIQFDQVDGSSEWNMKAELEYRDFVLNCVTKDALERNIEPRITAFDVNCIILRPR